MGYKKIALAFWEELCEVLLALSVGVWRRRDGAPEREMRGDAGWDEKHEMSWEHYWADTRGATQRQRLVLWVADGCGFRRWPSAGGTLLELRCVWFVHQRIEQDTPRLSCFQTSKRVSPGLVKLEWRRRLGHLSVFPRGEFGRLNLFIFILLFLDWEDLFLWMSLLNFWVDH